MPLIVLGGMLLAAAVARFRDPSRRERFLVLAGSGWHAIGPAVAIGAAGMTAPSIDRWPVLVAALAAQFACDAGSNWVRNCYGLGLPRTQLVGALRLAFLVDLMLAPIGLAFAMALPGTPLALLFVVPLLVLLAMLQYDRRRYLDGAVAMSAAIVTTADAARRDRLTGLRNRLAWEEAIGGHADDPRPIGLVLADADGLKAANDRHGHDMGDRLLVAIAAAVARSVPDDPAALAARLGGDEFGILLPGHLAHRAPEIAARLSSEIGATAAIDGVIPVSASVGAGTAPDGRAFSRAFMSAERAVYEEKARLGVTRG